MQEFLRKHKKKAILLSGIAIIILFSQVFNRPQNSNSTKFESYLVKKDKIIQEIEASGSLKANLETELSFQKSGKVKEIKAEIGKEFKKNEIIAQIDNAKELSSLNQAKAQLEEATANYNLQNAPAKTQTIQSAEANILQANANLKQTEIDLLNTQLELEQTQKAHKSELAKLDLQLKSEADKLEKAKANLESTTSSSTQNNSSGIRDIENASNLALSNLQNSIQVLKNIVIDDGNSTLVKSDFNRFDYRLLNDAQNKYLDALQKYNAAFSYFSANNSNKSLEEIIKQAETISSGMTAAFEGTKSAIEMIGKIPSSITLSDAQLESIKTSLVNANNSLANSQTQINQRIENLKSTDINSNQNSTNAKFDLIEAENRYNQKLQEIEQTKVNQQTIIANLENKIRSTNAKIETNKAEITKQEANLSEITAPKRSVDLAPFLARINQAKAQVESANSEYENTLIRAPFKGKITSKDIEIGEISTGSSDIAFKMIDDSKYIIEVLIPETRISAIDEDSIAEITFDAFPSNEIFKGKVLYTELSASSTDSTVYYVARIGLETQDSRFRPDLSANIKIITDSEIEAIIIPEKAISLNEGKKFVDVIASDGKVSRREVTTGQRAKNAMIEVTFGLEENEQIQVRKN